MINTTTNTSTITRQFVPEDQRLAITAELFGTHFPLRLEPTIYGITARIAPDYLGGYWDLFALDNCGFYMAPAGDQIYRVVCFNHWRGELSADALGITACLTAYSHLSFSGDMAFASVCADHYYRLRSYMANHTEIAAILRATD